MIANFNSVGRRQFATATTIGIAGFAVLVPVYIAQGLPWPHAIAAALMVVVPGLLFGGAAWRFARRVNAPVPWWRAFLVHGLAAAGFALGWCAAIYFLALLVHRQAAEAFLYNGAPWQVVGGLILYAAIVSGALRASARAELTAQALATTRAELQALRAQVDPHFLFNTLHSLTQLAREDPAATETALERFGELMRYVLSTGRSATHLVTLEDELAFVRNYLDLERLRLGDRLRVIEDIDPEALECALPPLILQPLVENAIRHAIAPRRDGGTIRISAALRANRIRLTIADDGMGSEPESWPKAAGLGLFVVRCHLEMRYPGESEMKVTTAPGDGFSVSIELPAQLVDRRAA